MRVFQAQRFGEYLLQDRIGAGGMAEIFLATADGIEGFKKRLVIKRILPTLSDDEQFVRMFIEEAKLCVALRHPNIVQVHDLGEIDAQYYIAMEYVDGRDLLKTLAACGRKKIGFPTDIALFIVMEVLKGLHYAHQLKRPDGSPLGIIHRDVSPSNVLLSFEGEVKIGDFGIAKAATREKTDTGILKGKFGYMAPEQVIGAKIDHRADVFAVGIVMYELLTGHRLFAGRNDLAVLERVRDARIEPLPRAYRADLDPELENIVLLALSQDRRDRYQNALELHDAIHDYVYRSRATVGHPHLGRFMQTLFLTEEDEVARRNRINLPVPRRFVGPGEGTGPMNGANGHLPPPTPPSGATAPDPGFGDDATESALSEQHAIVVDDGGWEDARRKAPPKVQEEVTALTDVSGSHDAVDDSELAREVEAIRRASEENNETDMDLGSNPPKARNSATVLGRPPTPDKDERPIEAPLRAVSETHSAKIDPSEIIERHQKTEEDPAERTDVEPTVRFDSNDRPPIPSVVDDDDFDDDFMDSTVNDCPDPDYVPATIDDGDFEPLDDDDPLMTSTVNEIVDISAVEDAAKSASHVNDTNNVDLGRGEGYSRARTDSASDTFEVESPDLPTAEVDEAELRELRSGIFVQNVVKSDIATQPPDVTETMESTSSDLEPPEHVLVQPVDTPEGAFLREQSLITNKVGDTTSSTVGPIPAMRRGVDDGVSSKARNVAEQVARIRKARRRGRLESLIQTDQNASNLARRRPIRRRRGRPVVVPKVEGEPELRRRNSVRPRPNPRRKIATAETELPFEEGRTDPLPDDTSIEPRKPRMDSVTEAMPDRRNSSGVTAALSEAAMVDEEIAVIREASIARANTNEGAFGDPSVELPLGFVDEEQTQDATDIREAIIRRQSRRRIVTQSVVLYEDVGGAESTHGTFETADSVSFLSTSGSLDDARAADLDGALSALDGDMPDFSPEEVSLETESREPDARDAGTIDGPLALDDKIPTHPARVDPHYERPDDSGGSDVFEATKLGSLAPDGISGEVDFLKESTSAVADNQILSVSREMAQANGVRDPANYDPENLTGLPVEEAEASGISIRFDELDDETGATEHEDDDAIELSFNESADFAMSENDQPTQEEASGALAGVDQMSELAEPAALMDETSDQRALAGRLISESFDIHTSTPDRKLSEYGNRSPPIEAPSNMMAQAGSLPRNPPKPRIPSSMDDGLAPVSPKGRTGSLEPIRARPSQNDALRAVVERSRRVRETNRAKGTGAKRAKGTGAPNRAAGTGRPVAAANGTNLPMRPIQPQFKPPPGVRAAPSVGPNGYPEVEVRGDSGEKAIAVVLSILAVMLVVIIGVVFVLGDKPKQRKSTRTATNMQNKKRVRTPPPPAPPLAPPTAPKKAAAAPDPKEAPVKKAAPPAPLRSAPPPAPAEKTAPPPTRKDPLPKKSVAPKKAKPKRAAPAPKRVRRVRKARSKTIKSSATRSKAKSKSKPKPKPKPKSKPASKRIAKGFGRLLIECSQNSDFVIRGRGTMEERMRINQKLKPNSYMVLIKRNGATIARETVQVLEGQTTRVKCP